MAMAMRAATTAAAFFPPSVSTSPSTRQQSRTFFSTRRGPIRLPRRLRAFPATELTLEELNPSVDLLRKTAEAVGDFRKTPIYIVGTDCNAKRNIAKLLANSIIYRYLCSEDLLEDVLGGKEALAAFRESDEKGYLEVETEGLKQLTSMGSLVLVCGDGAVMNSTNLGLLRHGVSIWIDVPLEMAVNDMLKSTGAQAISDPDSFSQEEEDKMKTKKELAVALMNDTPSSGVGDHKEEVKSVSNLLSLLGASAPAPANGGATADQLASQLLNERRSALGKKKNALLIELLNGDGQGREQKMSEVVAAGRQLLDDLAAHEERRSHLAFTTELRSLQQTVESNRLFAARDYKKAMDSVEAAKMEVLSANASVKAARMEVQSASAYVQSLRSDVRRLETGMAAAKSEAKEALGTAESTNEELIKLQGRVTQVTKDLEGTKFLSCLLFWVGLGGGTFWLFN